MKVHQATVDTYLEDVILAAVRKAADEQVSRKGLLFFCHKVVIGLTEVREKTKVDKNLTHS